MKKPFAWNSKDHIALMTLRNTIILCWRGDVPSTKADVTEMVKMYGIETDLIETCCEALGIKE